MLGKRGAAALALGEGVILDFALKRTSNSRGREAPKFIMRLAGLAVSGRLAPR
jgi:hypothetical protein